VVDGDAEIEAALARSGGSDKVALGRAVAKYGRKIVILARAAGCGDEAPDVCSETFLELRHHFAAGGRARSLSKLLSTIALNKARSHMRRIRRSSARGDKWAQQERGVPDDSPEDRAITALDDERRHEALNCLPALIEALPEKLRDVVSLRVYESALKHREIAERLNITAAASRQRYCDAIRILRRKLDFAEQ
jgi:RNA polymerase sigma factor (sigma-70 family)